ncbi:MAG TPA: flagellar basal-body rod protein FlgF [Deltaproteobacteria bacterium]|nr:flagellar basal-body rod protein FlgF [Deltaproteobacteria bacterium]
MGSDSYISASGAAARVRDLDVVSNNLANAGTPGYKRSESIFRSVFETSLRDARGRAVAGAPMGAFVKTDFVGTDFAQGSAERTGSPLHAMIKGSGFFVVETSRGPRYTRSGNFSINREGQLATPKGDAILGESGPIKIPDGDARILPNGQVTDSRGNVFGRLKVVDFGNLQKLSREGDSLFRAAPEASEVEVDELLLVPGSIEGSNVQTARELSALVELQRAYETNLRAMQVDDETTQRLIEGIR